MPRHSLQIPGPTPDPFQSDHHFVCVTSRTDTGRCLLIAGLVLTIMLPALGMVSPSAGVVLADEAAEQSAETVREQARRNAVAFNYCSAAFYRIKRFPTKATLVEEREQILNNLNLASIDDSSVIRLYTGVLDEIGQLQIAERERHVIRERHRRIFREQMGSNIFVGATQIATGQVVGAVRTGVNSWWDYRSMDINRESETWKVEKTRMSAIVSKSSQFLESLWNLSRKDIPDHWLLRESNLVALDNALKEPKVDRRLRILQRMESEMECYPPFLYYLARTQQQSGDLVAAASTYDELAKVGTGHFRRDHMLAAGLANLAAIEESQGRDTAVETAARALQHSRDVWQANLLCAGILYRHGRDSAAREAILCNLDVELEQDQSLVALTSLLLETGNRNELVKLIDDREYAERLPSPVLMQCVAALGQASPQHARTAVDRSFYGYADLRFGTDDLVFLTAPGWRLEGARVAMKIPGHTSIPGQIRPSKQGYEIRFPNIAELGNPFKPERMFREAALQVSYRNGTRLGLTLSREGKENRAIAKAETRRPDLLNITQYQIGDVVASLDGDAIPDRDTDTLLGDRPTRAIEVSQETSLDEQPPEPESPPKPPAPRDPDMLVELLPLEPID